MGNWASIPSAGLRRDLLAGSVAGLIGGLVFWWALAAQDMTASVPGVLGLELFAAWPALHLLVSALLGACFGAISRYQPEGYAGLTSGGLLWGLLWWIAGPMTLSPLLGGLGPSWSILEASTAFPSLIGHLLYGGVTGLGLYATANLYLRYRPEVEAPETRAEAASKHILILGGGFAGISAAQRLERLFAHDPSVDVTLVSQSNALLFTPMLAEVASSAVEGQHISAPIRASCPNTQFYRAEVLSIDADLQVIRMRSGPSPTVEEVSYDHLVLALGSIPSFYGLPGMEQHSFTLKTLEDATRLRNHIIYLLEDADFEPDEEQRRKQLTFVVAGGGFAGTETMAELFDLVNSVLGYYSNLRAEYLRFVLVHSRDRILPELSDKLGDYAIGKLRDRGIEFLLNTRVTGATADSVLLEGQGPLPACTVVWTAGNQPNPLLSTLACERNRNGAVIVDETLRVTGLVNVWAVGDCAQVPDADVEGQAYPPTAQHALREGKVVAENIAATLRGRPLKRFRFQALGVLVGLGHRTAAAEIRGLRFSGLLAWLMWRSIYLSKLPGIEKKVRVALDWTIDLFFPRDIALTSVPDRIIHPADSESSQEAANPNERVQ